LKEILKETSLSNVVIYEIYVGYWEKRTQKKEKGLDFFLKKTTT
jgi:hypothetical protein